MRPNPLTYCLQGETGEIDRLLGDFLKSCIGKNDMAVANAMLAAAAIIVATHCQRTDDDFGEFSKDFIDQFKRALVIAGECL